MKSKSKKKQPKEIHCFQCRQPFQDVHGNPTKIYRNLNRYPLCGDCMRDDLNFEAWDDDAIDWIMGLLDREIYNGNYNKLYNDFIEVKCPKCGDVTSYLGTEKNGDGTFFRDTGSEGRCYSCHQAYYFFDKDGKVVEWYPSEEEFYNKEKEGRQIERDLYHHFDLNV